MADSKTIDSRVDFAVGLLESKVRPVCVCTMLQAKFHVSRSQAYVDIKEAEALLSTDGEPGQADEGLATSEPAIDVESIQGQLVYLLGVKVSEGDTKAVSQCVKALDTVNQWNGMKSTLQASHKTGFCN